MSVYVNSDGQLGTLTSSKRFKQNIQKMGNTSDVLYYLHPVTFKYRPGIDPNGTLQFGLVAEHVEKVDRPSSCATKGATPTLSVIRLWTRCS